MKERVNSINRLLEEREADFRVEYRKVWKDNEEKEAYIIVSDSANCTPVMYRGQWTEKPNEDVVDYLCLAVSEYSLVVDTQGLTNGEELKGRILPRLSSKDNMDAMKMADIFCLENVFPDIVISYYFPVALTPDRSGCVQLTNTMMDALALTPDEVYEAAVKNMEGTIDIMSIDEMLASMCDVELDVAPSDPPALTVLTNHEKQLGAAVVLCPGIFERLKKRIGSERLVMLPSSVHEVLVAAIDEDADLSAYSNMVREVNVSVDPEDRLAEHAYLWKNNVLEAIA